MLCIFPSMSLNDDNNNIPDYTNHDHEYLRNKKKQIRLIIDMLENNNVIEPIDNFSNENDPYRQKIVRTIKKFLSEMM